MKVKQSVYGSVGKYRVNCYTVKNSKKTEVSIINYGGRIVKLCTADKNGKTENIVIGYSNIKQYVEDRNYFGAICGRVAGRIRGAAFELDGYIYKLNKNDGNNHLHGGIKNFSHVIWDAEIIETDTQAGVILSYISEDTEEGYPGQARIKVSCLLNENNELLVYYEGIADKNTLINLTNHTYFNLCGNLKRDILSHLIKINSDKIAQLDLELLPTGKLLNVLNTPFDLRSTRVLKEQFSQKHEQLTIGSNGFDHPFILNENFNNEIFLAEEKSGRSLIVETDQKCVVVYTSNKPVHNLSVQSVKEIKHFGICLETQGLPDAINNKHFPQVTVFNGHLYSANTKFKFGII